MRRWQPDRVEELFRHRLFALERHHLSAGDDAPIEWKLKELKIPYTPQDVVRVREAVETVSAALAEAMAA